MIDSAPKSTDDEVRTKAVVPQSRLPQLTMEGERFRDRSVVGRLSNCGQKKRQAAMAFKEEWNDHKFFHSFSEQPWMLTTRHLWMATNLLAGGAALANWWETLGDKGHAVYSEETDKYKYKLFLMQVGTDRTLRLKPVKANESEILIRCFSNLAASMSLLFSVCASNNSDASGSFVLSANDIIRELQLTNGKKSERLKSLFEAMCCAASFIVSLGKVNYEKGKEPTNLEPVKVWELDFEFFSTEESADSFEEAIRGTLDWSKVKDFYVAVNPGKWVTLLGAKVGQTKKIPFSVIIALVRSGRSNDLLGLALSDLIFRVAMGRRRKIIYGRTIFLNLMGYKTEVELELASHDPYQRTKIADRFDRFLGVASKIYNVTVGSRKFWSCSGLYQTDDGTIVAKSGKDRRPKGFFSVYRDSTFIFSMGTSGEEQGSKTTSISFKNNQWLEALIAFVSENQITQDAIAKAIGRSQSYVSKVFAGHLSFNIKEREEIAKAFPAMKDFRFKKRPKNI